MKNIKEELQNIINDKENKLIFLDHESRGTQNIYLVLYQVFKLKLDIIKDKSLIFDNISDIRDMRRESYGKSIGANCWTDGTYKYDPDKVSGFIDFQNLTNDKNKLFEYIDLIIKRKSTYEKLYTVFHNLLFPELIIEDDKNNESQPTERIEIYLERLKRVTSKVNKIKKEYENACQICGMQLNINENKYYSEVHHIIPLGQPHNGTDELDNMICVCPNHHVQLGYFAIKLDLKKFKLIKHNINQASIDYHNSNVSFNL